MGQTERFLHSPMDCMLDALLPSTHPHVQLVVQVLVDLLGVTVLLEQATQHAGAADPQDLGGQARLTGTMALT